VVPSLQIIRLHVSSGSIIT